jgi:hypothetical protein
VRGSGRGLNVSDILILEGGSEKIYDEIAVLDDTAKN